MFNTVGFVPIINGLVRRMGGKTNAAYIYGYMWLHRSDSHFDEPLENISDELGIGRTAVFKWVPWLCENGYLVDETPDKINEPHTYLLTDKVTFDWSIEIKVTPKYKRRAVRKADGVPFGIRTAHGGSESERHLINHDHDHDHAIRELIREIWDYFGLHLRALPKMLETWAGNVEGLAWLLEKYVEADEAGLMETGWNQAKLYRRLEAGEMPPEKPRTIGDEVRELMELQNGGEIE